MTETRPLKPQPAGERYPVSHDPDSSPLSKECEPDVNVSKNTFVHEPANEKTRMGEWTIMRSIAQPAVKRLS